MTSNPIVVCSGVARSFGHGMNAVVAVHGLDCRVERGDEITLNGASGSGKSTLLHLLAGLDAPTTGTVEWPALGDRAQLRPEHVSFVFQGQSLIPALDVLENVTLPLLLGGCDDADARDKALRMLTELGVRPLATRLPEELSAGQSQRVAIARALVGSPALILADEPTGQLDGTTAIAVIDAIAARATELGAALIVATHDTRIAGRLRTQWTMSDGRVDAGAACSA